jgi:hypothetical protein
MGEGRNSFEPGVEGRLIEAFGGSMSDVSRLPPPARLSHNFNSNSRGFLLLNHCAVVISLIIIMTQNPLTLTRQALYELAWSKPMTDVAKQFGISDVGLAKRCRAVDVPIPYRGYWARVAAGQTPAEIPLPKYRTRTPTLAEPPAAKRPPKEVIREGIEPTVKFGLPTEPTPESPPSPETLSLQQRPGPAPVSFAATFKPHAAPLKAEEWSFHFAMTVSTSSSGRKVTSPNSTRCPLRPRIPITKVRKQSTTDRTKNCSRNHFCDSSTSTDTCPARYLPHQLRRRIPMRKKIPMSTTIKRPLSVRHVFS